MGAVAAVYFEPAARPGLNRLAHSSLPELALSGVPAALGRLALAAAFFLAAWGVGNAILRLRPLRAADPGTALGRSLAAFGLGLGALSLLALALSPLGALRPGALVAIVVAGALLGLYALARERPKPGGSLRSLRARARREPLAAACVVLLAAAGAWALVAALAPEVEYDALWYHLELPQQYLAAGKLVDERCEYVSLYPMGAELLYAYGLALNGPVVAKLVSFGFWVLFALATYELAARVAGRRAALVAAAVAALTPTALWEATTAYVDVALAFFLTLSLIWVLRFLERRAAASLALAGLFGGFALMVKTLAVLGLVALALVLLFGATGARVRRRVADVLMFGALALLPAAPWLLRAEIEGGNPVFPSLYGLFGADADRWSAAAADSNERALDRWGHGDGLGGLVSLPWDLTMHGAAFAGCMGVLFLMLVPLALTRRLSRGLVILGAFAAVYVLLWASPLSSQQMRFLLPVVPALAVLAGAGFARAVELAEGLHPRAAAVPALLVTGVLALSLPLFTGLHDREGHLTLPHVLRGAPLDVVSGADREQAYLTRVVPAYAAARTLDPTDHALASTDPYTDLYASARLTPDYSACVGIAGGRAGNTRSELRALRRLGVTHLLVEPRLRASDAALEVTRHPPPPGSARIVHDDGRALVYELLPPE